MINFSKIKKILLKRKEGDAVLAGRLNDAIVLTFDTSTEKGIIDIHVGRTDETGPNRLHKTAARIIVATKSKIDDEYKNKTLGLGNAAAPKLVLIADELRIVSPEGGEVEPFVLGEKLTSFLDKLMEALKNHIHPTAMGPTSPSTDLVSVVIKMKNELKDLKSKHVGVN